MNNTVSKVLRLTDKLLRNDFNNEDLLIALKEIAMNFWEQGRLTDSEHCDLESFFDNKLRELDICMD